MIYATEKNLKEMGDKIDAALKAQLEDKIAQVKKVMEGDSKEAIDSAVADLTQASHKLAEGHVRRQDRPGGGDSGARRRERGLNPAGPRRMWWTRISRK